MRKSLTGKPSRFLALLLNALNMLWCLLRIPETSSTMWMYLALARWQNCWKVGSLPGWGLNEGIAAAHHRGGASKVVRWRVLMSRRLFPFPLSSFINGTKIVSTCDRVTNPLLLTSVARSNMSASYCSTNRVSASWMVGIEVNSSSVARLAVSHLKTKEHTHGDTDDSRGSAAG